MPALVKMPQTHLNSFHTSNSLLFQFILHDFLLAYHVLSTAQPKEIANTMAKLSGASSHHMRLFSWGLDSGILARLKNYCAFFSDNLQDESDIVAMYRCADKAWLLSLECLDNSTEEGVNKVSSQLSKFGKLVDKVALQFSDDENVVYFFLRHHQEFDQVVSRSFVYKLLNKMYPRGVSEAERFLVSRYSKRGFDSLLPAISSKIVELS